MDNWLPALIIAGISSLMSFAVSWGYNRATMDGVNKTIDKHGSYHSEHYAHATNTDMHWTRRERDELTKRIDEIADDLKELLRRNGGPR